MYTIDIEYFNGSIMHQAPGLLHPNVIYACLFIWQGSIHHILLSLKLVKLSAPIVSISETKWTLHGVSNFRCAREVI